MGVVKIINSSLDIIILIMLIILLVVLILIGVVASVVASVCVIKAFFEMINEAKDE